MGTFSVCASAKGSYRLVGPAVACMSCRADPPLATALHKETTLFKLRALAAATLRSVAISACGGHGSQSLPSLQAKGQSSAAIPNPMIALFAQASKRRTLGFGTAPVETDYALAANSQPDCIVVGSDGNQWLTELTANKMPVLTIQPMQSPPTASQLRPQAHGALSPACLAARMRITSFLAKTRGRKSAC